MLRPQSSTESFAFNSRCYRRCNWSNLRRHPWNDWNDWKEMAADRLPRPAYMVNSHHGFPKRNGHTATRNLTRSGTKWKAMSPPLSLRPWSPGLLWRRGVVSDLFREDADQAMHTKAIKLTRAWFVTHTSGGCFDGNSLDVV